LDHAPAASHGCFGKRPKRADSTAKDAAKQDQNNTRKLISKSEMG